MPASRTETLQIASTRIVVDGRARPGTVQLTRGAAGEPWRVATIDAVSVDGIVDVGDALVVPAPLDLHIHGSGGAPVPPDGSVDAIDQSLARASEAAGWGHAATGRPTYDWIATLPAPGTSGGDIVEHVAAAAGLIADAPRTRCVGLRIEGLFLNPARAGVWPAASFHAPSVELFEQAWRAARDGGTPLRILDIAPELPGALAVIEAAVAHGVVVSLAHSDASYDQARAAIDVGARLATHTWNAMRGLTHREPGIVGAVLTDERVTCELICDGFHVHPAVLQLTTAAVGTGRWVAISDASPFANQPPGAYEWAGIDVTHDGATLRDNAGTLAGAASTLDAAFTLLGDVGIDELERAIALGAAPRRVLEPARTLGLHADDPVWVVSID